MSLWKIKLTICDLNSEIKTRLLSVFEFNLIMIVIIKLKIIAWGSVITSNLVIKFIWSKKYFWIGFILSFRIIHFLSFIIRKVLSSQFVYMGLWFSNSMSVKFMINLLFCDSMFFNCILAWWIIKIGIIIFVKLKARIFLNSRLYSFTLTSLTTFVILHF